MQASMSQSRAGVRTMRAPLRARPAPRVRLTPIAQAQAAATRKMKVITGNNVVRISGNLSMNVSCATQSQPGVTLTDYMHNCVNFFDEIELPLGGKLEHVQGDIFNLSVPRFDVFDIWMKPLARSVVIVAPNYINITSNECTVSGSHHVQDLKLNERFGLEVNITFSWQDTPGTGKIATDGYLKVDIDIPMPFSLMPKPVLEAAGNTAMGVTLNVLLTTFVQSLARDYERWSTNPALRQQRAGRPVLIPPPARN